ncbi:MAG: dihydrofolate reductase family protein [Cyanobacteriota bacterium]|nr:dihydrofolate reductase family protein [Cyanobacteriota bacterium]
MVLAVSLDGRLAPPQGGAAQIGGRGDRRVLEEALAWADAALLGAETLRRHGCTCLIHHPDLLAARALAGLSPQPLALVASRSGLIPPALPFFRQPLERWLLAPAALAAGAPQRGFARGVVLAGWPEALEQLAGLGIGRLAVLGGAALAGALLAGGLLDELQLSLCPRLLGGPHPWLPLGQPLAPSAWELREQRLLEGGELLLRYGALPSGAAG